MRKKIHLYSNDFQGIEKDGVEAKWLRINYLQKYQSAIISDNLWMEKHYFQKLLTCISYDNFPDYIVHKLHKIFFDRAEYLSLYYAQFCKGIEDDEWLPTNAEKSSHLHNYKYCFTTSKNQVSHYEHIFSDDLKKLFKLYQYNGFASDKSIQQYQDCLHLFKYSHMEAEMISYFQRNHIDCVTQKTFPDLLSPNGNLLRFDGYIVKNGQPILIECQGEQHYRPISFFGGDETFQKQCLYDRLKKEYCIAHNIPLLCIRYNQNVSKTIQRFLKRKSYKEIVYEYA